MVFSTYLGGSGDDEGASVTTDFEGNAYVFGPTDSSNFPICDGALQTTHSTCNDLFITKMKPNGSIVYSRYLGGSRDDYGCRIAVDSPGSSYVIGTTALADFPTTPGAVESTNAGGADAFVAKLYSTGELHRSTKFGWKEKKRF